MEVRRDLGSQAGHELFGSLTYYRADQTAVRTLNLQAYSAEGGGVYKAGRTSITPLLLFDHVLLAQETFLRNRGARLRVDQVLSRRASLYAEFKDVYQDYAPTSVVPVAKERTGIQIDSTLGGGYVLSPTMKLDLGLTYTVKRAEQHYDAFNREALAFAHTWLLGKGTFLLTSANLCFDQYWTPDITISSNHRKDIWWRAGETYGTPLGFINPALKDLVWTFSYDYLEAHSTVMNYAYTNNKVSTMLTYRWELGL